MVKECKEGGAMTDNMNELFLLLLWKMKGLYPAVVFGSESEEMRLSSWTTEQIKK